MKYICTQCHTKSNGKKHMKGSFLIEIVLWLSFIIPGIIYSLWRLTTKSRVCPECEAATLIPVSSPVAQKLLKVTT